MNDLDKIFIRARDENGEWGSFSLEELINKELGGQIGHWFFDKIRKIIGFEEGEIITQEHVLKMIEVLEYLNVPIVKLK